MNDPSSLESRKPGIVIFVAVLNFISAAMMSGLFLFSLLGLFFGSALSAMQTVSRRLSEVAASANLSFGVTFIFAALFMISAALLIFFIWVAFGLLRAKKAAWYVQIALSILGLLSVPLGTVINTVILVLFFQRPVRDYFKV